MAPRSTAHYHSLPETIDDDYEISDSTLGEGVNGDVKLGIGKATRQSFAVKQLSLQDIDQAKEKMMRSEAEVLFALDHPHIVRLADAYDSGTKMHLVMENLKGGDLHDHLNEVGKFSERDAADKVFQMLLALDCIHGQGIVHRDIKIEHFMYESSARETLKLIDFGFARRWQADVDEPMKETVGTFGYAAPEMLFQKGYTSQVDLWGIGVISYILMIGHMPFLTTPTKEVLAEVMQGNFIKRPEEWGALSQDASDFIHGCLTVDPGQRLTAQTALAHPWITRDRPERQALSGIERMLKDGSMLKELHDIDMLGCLTKAPSRRRRSMEALACSVPVEAHAKVTDAFLAMDSHSNGLISPEELEAVMHGKAGVILNDVHAMAAALSKRSDAHEGLVITSFQMSQNFEAPSGDDSDNMWNPETPHGQAAWGRRKKISFNMQDCGMAQTQPLKIGSSIFPTIRSI